MRKPWSRLITIFNTETWFAVFDCSSMADLQFYYVLSIRSWHRHRWTLCNWCVMSIKLQLCGFQIMGLCAEMYTSNLQLGKMLTDALCKLTWEYICIFPHEIYCVLEQVLYSSYIFQSCLVFFIYKTSNVVVTSFQFCSRHILRMVTL